MQSGKPVGAQDALEAGIVDQLVSAGEVLNHALFAAKDYAQLPPNAYQTVKMQVREGTIALIDQAITGSAEGQEGGWFTQETKAAMAKMIAAR